MIPMWNCRGNQAELAAMRDGNRDAGCSDESLKPELLKEACAGCVAKALGEPFWACPECAHPQPGEHPAYPSLHPCKGCGKAMCEDCRMGNSYCSDCRRDGE